MLRAQWRIWPTCTPRGWDHENLQEALPLYEQAAEAGEFLAQVELARMYARGVGVATNPEMARKWYTAAAVQEASVGDCEELREAKAYSRKPS